MNKLRTSGTAILMRKLRANQAMKKSPTRKTESEILATTDEQQSKKVTSKIKDQRVELISKARNLRVTKSFTIDSASKNHPKQASQKNSDITQPIVHRAGILAQPHKLDFQFQPKTALKHLTTNDNKQKTLTEAQKVDAKKRKSKKVEEASDESRSRSSVHRSLTESWATSYVTDENLQKVKV